MPRIISIGTAVPAHRIEQEEARTHAEQLLMVLAEPGVRVGARDRVGPTLQRGGLAGVSRFLVQSIVIPYVAVVVIPRGVVVASGSSVVVIPRGVVIIAGSSVVVIPCGVVIIAGSSIVVIN